VSLNFQIGIEKATGLWKEVEEEEEETLPANQTTPPLSNNSKCYTALKSLDSKV
jgi:hypothetical protein